jgi:hypothetical protein
MTVVHSIGGACRTRPLWSSRNSKYSILHQHVTSLYKQQEKETGGERETPLSVSVLVPVGGLNVAVARAV